MGAHSPQMIKNSVRLFRSLSIVNQNSEFLYQLKLFFGFFETLDLLQQIWR